MGQPKAGGDSSRDLFTLDAMHVEPLSSEQRRSAALTVCDVMDRAGATAASVREILEMLDVAGPQLRLV
jgi:hypothetical protein